MRTLSDHEVELIVGGRQATQTQTQTGGGTTSTTTESTSTTNNSGWTANGNVGQGGAITGGSIGYTWGRSTTTTTTTVTTTTSGGGSGRGAGGGAGGGAGAGGSASSSFDGPVYVNPSNTTRNQRDMPAADLEGLY